MVYVQDMRAAARRLSQAALKIDQDAKRAVAAYLFGLAAECALKFVATKLPNGTKELVQYTHFPTLRTALRELQTGRNVAALRRVIEDDSFFNEWAIDIRYARAADINDKPLDRWKENAVTALKLMEGW